MNANAFRLMLFTVPAVFVSAESACAERASEWISVPSAKVSENCLSNNWGDQRASDGTSWFATTLVNPSRVMTAKWTVAGLGVFEVYVNGVRVGNDFLKPGFSHSQKTKYSFTYDITHLLKTGAGDGNAFSAAVSAGWWRDKIVNFVGKKSAFRAELELTFSNGERKTYGTNCDDWHCGVAGRVIHAGIFDGESYDARRVEPYFGEGLVERPEINAEFNGELLPSSGAEVCLREDLAIRRGPFEVKAGVPFVIDFSQNCSAVPCFHFRAARGTVLTALPGEMLNDADCGERGCDGPKGSLYRANLRIPETGMRIEYVFSGEGLESYMPRFTYFGYRYVSITTSADVSIESVESVPVSSIKKEHELGRLETGNDDVNRLISNVYWGQLSNYLSIPTDCPQRNERLGWTADTQVFAEAGSFNADTSRFFCKWMRDMRDSRNELGSFPGVAPTGQYGDDMMRFGWADAGIIVPYQIWKQFGCRQIVDENWAAMRCFMKHVHETRYDHEAVKKESNGRQWADWLSYEALESRGGGAFVDKERKIAKQEAIVYWNYLGACYWLWDAQMMATIAAATGRDASEYKEMAEVAKSHLSKCYFNTADGALLPLLRDMQTPALFALKLGLVSGMAKEKTIQILRRNFADHDGCLQTGFLGTSILMDVLTESGMADIAYGLLLQRKNPSWLYSVDQGATTIWERWNSYTQERGFGPVDMNSFNHYAYGSVLAWMYKTMAGIAADETNPGFGTIRMMPIPDRRMGFVRAEYKTRFGLVKSFWRYEGEEWVWDFEIPVGAKGLIRIPKGDKVSHYGPGKHQVRMKP